MDREETGMADSRREEDAAREPAGPEPAATPADESDGPVEFVVSPRFAGKVEVIVGGRARRFCAQAAKRFAPHALDGVSDAPFPLSREERRLPVHSELIREGIIVPRADAGTEREQAPDARPREEEQTGQALARQFFDAVGDPDAVFRGRSRGEWGV
jgi:hypothetical protein